MRSDACRAMREYIGAYVLGALEPDKQAALLAHLDGCPDCRDEVSELAAVARALPLADPLRSAGRPLPPDHLGDAIVDRIATERAEARRRGFRRASVVGLTAAALIAAVFVVIGILDSSQQTTLDLASTSGPGKGSVVLEYHRWGTEVRLAVAELPREAVYGVWLERSNGDRVSAGSFWTPEQGDVEVTLSAAMNLKDCKGIGISDENDNTVMHSEVDWSE
jgi:anti-sigma factor RsiW